MFSLPAILRGIRTLDCMSVLSVPLSRCDYDPDGDNGCWMCEPVHVTTCEMGSFGYQAAKAVHMNADTGKPRVKLKGDAVGTLHRRFGHLGLNNLERLKAEKMVVGLGASLKALKEYDAICETCIVGKQVRPPFHES